jgi:predicted anti-sigma-YlaC factor YlaD
MISCEEASRLVSADVDRSLTFVQRIRMQIHLLQCRRCRAYRAFVRWLQARATKVVHADLSEFPELSESVKQETVERINRSRE